ncbi:MAG: VOC family protein, partial [Saccharothrix sp.]|nr:VOC family protein [Saccharothrix sp.]
MSSRLHHITVDCKDAHALATFWSQVTGHPVSDEDDPGDPECLVALPAGPDLLFIQVPEGKTVKNRLHLDLQPDTTRDQEVERLRDLGAT